MKRRHWDQQAPNWIAWTRELADDAYRDYAPTFFDGFVPMGADRALDVGCGEGRSSRDLAAISKRTFAVDGSFRMLRAAAEHERAVAYVHADAARLPFSDDSFDLIVAYNSLMDLDELDAALAECARVLRDGGALAACVLHPFAEAGAFETRERDARFVIEGSYFDEGSYTLTFERDGHRMTFSSFRYTLETYVEKLRRAGFVIDAIEEPRPIPEAITRDPGETRWARVPLFLFLRGVKP